MDITVIRALHHSSTSIRGEVHPGTMKSSEVVWVVRPGSAVDDAQHTMPMAITQEDAIPMVLQEVRPVLWQPLRRQPFWPELITLLELLDDVNVFPVLQIEMHQCAGVLIVLWLQQCCQKSAIWTQADSSGSKIGRQLLSPTGMPPSRAGGIPAHAWVNMERRVLEQYDKTAIGNEQALGAFRDLRPLWLWSIVPCKHR